MSRSDERPVVLTMVGHFLPGYKAGGILRSVANLANRLHREFHFKIVTRDRDLGDLCPYVGVSSNRWQRVENAEVYYLSPGTESFGRLRTILNETPHDLLYLNSFFEPLTIKTLSNRRFRRSRDASVIVAPRGEFAWASLRLKYAKKLLFMRLARICSLYKDVLWHASSTFEAEDISRVMGIPRQSIRVALDLPGLPDDGSAVLKPALRSRSDALRLVFLGRIAPEKNVEYALNVLRKVDIPVEFDIVGPVENPGYWGRCERLIRELPSCVKVRFCGSVTPERVPSLLADYDLLFFPTGGENYGHVIAEALAAGTPVLISKNTPWQNLEPSGLGWDLPLEAPEAFRSIIERLGRSSMSERLSSRERIRREARQLVSAPTQLGATRELFASALAANKKARDLPCAA